MKIIDSTRTFADWLEEHPQTIDATIPIASELESVNIPHDYSADERYMRSDGDDAIVRPPSKVRYPFKAIIAKQKEPPRLDPRVDSTVVGYEEQIDWLRNIFFADQSNAKPIVQRFIADLKQDIAEKTLCGKSNSQPTENVRNCVRDYYRALGGKYYCSDNAPRTPEAIIEAQRELQRIYACSVVADTTLLGMHEARRRGLYDPHNVKPETTKHNDVNRELGNKLIQEAGEIRRDRDDELKQAAARRLIREGKRVLDS